MRHHNKNKKFGRVRKGRTALMRSLARSLILHGKIQTTETKAKALRPFVEKLVTKAKNNTLATRRLIIKQLGGEERATGKLMETISPRFKDRPGGYTRITKIHKVSDDARKHAQIEFLEQ